MHPFKFCLLGERENSVGISPGNAMEHSTRLHTIAVIAICLLCFSAISEILFRMDRQTTAIAGATLREFEFVLDSLTKQDESVQRHTATRWTHPATIRIANGDSRVREAVRSVVQEINTALMGTGMHLSLVHADEADIVLDSHPTGMLWRTKDRFSCEAWGQDFGFFCATLSPSTDAIASAVIGIASDLPDQHLRSLVLEELAQTLGPMADGTHFEDSLFYEPAGRKDPLWGKSMSPRDKKLLRFLYLHLAPGDGPKEILAAFKKHWFSIDAGPEK